MKLTYVAFSVELPDTLDEARYWFEITEPGRSPKQARAAYHALRDPTREKTHPTQVWLCGDEKPLWRIL